jgi:Uri superfamily endonuclease
LKGTYLLILRLEADLTDLPIGRLGQFHFAAGYYVYIGSAFGPGGLVARIGYHERRVKARPRWHIDYLRPYTHMVEAWSVGSTMRVECCWTRALISAPDVSIPVLRFGASDNDCPSHLLYTRKRPPLRLLTETLLSCFTDQQEQNLTLEIRDYEGVKG